MIDVNFLGIPFNLGQELAGVKKSYQYFKEKGLFESLSLLPNISHIDDLGELKLSSKLHYAHDLHWTQIKNYPQVDHDNFMISSFIESLDLDKKFLVNIGGDHGMSLGTIHGILSHFPEAIIIWVDAHGDINTPDSSLTKNFHGMPLAYLLDMVSSSYHFPWMKNFLKKNKIIHLGGRDLDLYEKKIFHHFDIEAYSSQDISQQGAKFLLEHALMKLDPLSKYPLFLSFDVDVFDENDMSATGTRVALGPSQDEIFQLGEFVGATGRLVGMDIVEFNPDLELPEQNCYLLVNKFIHQTLSFIPNKMTLTSIYNNGEKLDFIGPDIL